MQLRGEMAEPRPQQNYGLPFRQDYEISPSLDPPLPFVCRTGGILFPFISLSSQRFRKKRLSEKPLSLGAWATD